jgi:hypothetical protein
MGAPLAFFTLAFFTLAGFFFPAAFLTTLPFFVPFAMTSSSLLLVCRYASMRRLVVGAEESIE